MNPRKFNTYFLAIDGDSVGRELEKLVISGDLGSLSIYGKSINESVDKIENIIEKMDGDIYLKGGDSILGEVAVYEDFLIRFHELKPFLAASFSIGIGVTVVEAYLALKFAKSSGRGLVMIASSSEDGFVFKAVSTED